MAAPPTHRDAPRSRRHDVAVDAAARAGLGHGLSADAFHDSVVGVRDGSVILFHEWRTETREQLPVILAELRRQEFGFVTFTWDLGDLVSMLPAKGRGVR